MDFSLSTILNETTWVLFCFLGAFFIKEISKTLSSIFKNETKYSVSYLNTLFISFSFGFLLDSSRTMFLFYILSLIGILYQAFKKIAQNKKHNLFLMVGNILMLFILVILKKTFPTLFTTVFFEKTSLWELLSFFIFLGIFFPIFFFIKDKTEQFKEETRKPLSFLLFWLLKHVGLTLINVAIFIGGSLLMDVEYKHFSQWISSVLELFGISSDYIHFVSTRESLATSENLSSLEILKDQAPTRKILNDLQIGIFRIPNTALQIMMSFVCLFFAYISSSFLQFAYQKTGRKKVKQPFFSFFSNMLDKKYFLAFSLLFLVMGIELSDHFLRSHSIINIFLFVISVFLLNKVLWKLTRNLTTSISVLFAFFGYAILKISGYFNPFLKYIKRNIISEIHFNSYAIELGDLRISLYDALVIVLLVIALKMFLKMKNFYISDLSIGEHSKDLFKKVLGFVFYFIFFIAFLTTLGIKFSHLAIFSGALAIGLGFGLQKIASNYLSGILILFENTLRIGDVVELKKGFIGVVKKLSGRYTLIQTLRGREVLVPNEEIIVNTFTNLTLSKKQIRIDIDLILSPQTNISKVCPLLVNGVGKCKRILKHPQPKAFIKSVEPEGFHVLVHFWIENLPKSILEAKSEALIEIYNVCQKRKISFSFFKTPLSRNSKEKNNFANEDDIN